MLHRDAEFGGAPEDGGQIDGERLAAQDLAAGGVAQNLDVGVLDGAQHPGGHFLAALVEAAVDAGDHHVHLRQHFVIEIDGAVAQNVHLDAGEDADAALHRAVGLANARQVLERPLLVEAAGHGQVLGVLSDGDVAQTARVGGLGHLEDAVAPVAFRGCACAHRRGCRPLQSAEAGNG